MPHYELWIGAPLWERASWYISGDLISAAFSLEEAKEIFGIKRYFFSFGFPVIWIEVAKLWKGQVGS